MAMFGIYVQFVGDILGIYSVFLFNRAKGFQNSAKSCPAEVWCGASAQHVRDSAKVHPHRPQFNKSLIAVLLKGNQWFINKALLNLCSWCVGGYVGGGVGWPVMREMLMVRCFRFPCSLQIWGVWVSEEVCHPGYIWLIFLVGEGRTPPEFFAVEPWRRKASEGNALFHLGFGEKNIEPYVSYSRRIRVVS